jgi:hypothetical protein
VLANGKWLRETKAGAFEGLVAEPPISCKLVKIWAIFLRKLIFQNEKGFICKSATIIVELHSWTRSTPAGLPRCARCSDRERAADRRSAHRGLGETLAATPALPSLAARSRPSETDGDAASEVRENTHSHGRECGG